MRGHLSPAEAEGLANLQFYAIWGIVILALIVVGIVTYMYLQGEFSSDSNKYQD